MNIFEKFKSSFFSTNVTHARINLIHRNLNATDLVVEYMNYVQRYEMIVNEYNHLFEDSIFFQDFPAITENSSIHLIDKIINYTNSMDEFKITLHTFVRYQQMFHQDLIVLRNRRQFETETETEKEKLNIKNKPYLIFEEKKQQQQQQQQQEECGICYETITKAGSFQCQHQYCMDCIEKLFQYSNYNCPLCREPISQITTTTTNNDDKLIQYCHLQQTK
jgi:hypothetical protein